MSVRPRVSVVIILTGAIGVAGCSRVQTGTTASSNPIRRPVPIPSVPASPGSPSSQASTRARPDLVHREVFVGRSVDGRRITAFQIGDPMSGDRLLVVGCIHGNECSGTAVARDLVTDPPPPGLDLWVIPDLNPDGFAAGSRQNAGGVDLNRNFPWKWEHIGSPGNMFYSGPHPLSEPESNAAAELILKTRPGISLWFHQHDSLVDESGGSLRIERRFARLVGLPLKRLPRYPGSVTGWQNHRLPGATAFVVELPSGQLTPSQTERFADAVLALT
jgi:protein MpaA